MRSWDTDPSSLFWFLLPGVVAPGIFLTLAFWQPTRRQVSRWGAVCNVVITDRNEEQVRSHLSRVRRFRSVAGYPFWVLAASPILIGRNLPFPLSSPVAVIVGYVVGGLIGELTSRTAGDPSLRTAPLLHRTFTDYLPRWLHWLPWVLVAVATLLVVLGPSPADPATNRSDAITAVGAAIAVACLAEVAGRRVVARPQRGRDLDLLAADDGLRAAAVSGTTAAAGLAGLLALSSATGSVLPSGMGWLAAPYLLGLLATNGVAVALLCCIVRQETLGYRRRYRQVAAGVPA